MSRRSRAAFVVAVTSVIAFTGPLPSRAAPVPSGSGAFLGGRKAPQSPELSATTRLGDRRSLVLGTRFYETGAQDATYPAQGWHTTGEMGGFWSQPIKLLDGLWFGVDGTWLKAQKYTSGFGYARMDLGTTAGVNVSRLDVAPDGMRSGLVGLRLTSAATRTVDLSVDAHSELMSAYPWGTTKPGQATENLRYTGSFIRNQLLFRDHGKARNTASHDWAAVVGSSLTPVSHALGAGHRGPQGSVVCPAGGQKSPCDDSVYGRGTGGRLTYRVKVPAGGRTVWFAVSGSDHGVAAAQREQQRALADPAAALAAKIASRSAVAGRTSVDLPGDPRLAQSVEWSKQNIADARQQAEDLRLRATHEGTTYPPPSGTLKTAKWLGAGWPDYPWILSRGGPAGRSRSSGRRRLPTRHGGCHGVEGSTAGVRTGRRSPREWPTCPSSSLPRWRRRPPRLRPA